MVVLTNPATTSPISLGKISKKIMRHVDSPLIRAAVTNSRLRIVSVCERSTRACHAQFVNTITREIVKGPRGKYAASTIASGSAGSTSETLVSNVNTSSIQLLKYPPTRPTTTESSVTNIPVPNPQKTLVRVPYIN